MKQKFIDLYMNWARSAAKLSHARRLQVGAVIVKDDTVISYGYNGMPAGWDNNCEDVLSTYDERDTHSMGDWQYDESTKKFSRLKTKPEVLHAEMNSLMKLAKSSSSGSQASMFVTHSPCLDCAKGIHQAGIKQVFYQEDYRDSAGIEFLRRSNVEVTKYEA
jgi:dCMP deaminase